MADAKTYRALIALDAQDIPRVLATDSPFIASEFDHCGTDAAQIGLLSPGDIGPGLWVWEGRVVVRNVADYEDFFPTWEAEYTGVYRMVEGDASALFALSPPEPEFPEDDRDSVGV